MIRQQQLNLWLQNIYPDQPVTLAPASADASFRRYVRATFSDHTLIVMDAPPQHEDCHPFIRIAQIFAQSGVHVPRIIAQDLAQGFLLLSDLGDITYLQQLNLDNARQLYNDACDALIKIQTSSEQGVLPPYDEALLLREMRLFPEWYIGKHLKITLNEKQQATLETAFQRIVQNNLAQPQVYVHRDYHSRNLMFIATPLSNSLPHTPLAFGSQSTRTGDLLAGSCPPRSDSVVGGRINEKGDFSISPGILDFQDAVYGPITYDLVSLFKDAYIGWRESDVLDWLIRYWENARKAGLPVHEDFGAFYRDYEWMGVQRHLKVLGIFARLSHRDGKDGYLQDMPLVMNYLRRACERYIDLKPLLNLLNELEPQAQQEGYTF
jgi:aminoglycoside/choline kinase family phosphotransferase